MAVCAAWRVHELGEPEAVLVLDDVEVPVPGPGDVVVEVAAASLNFPDVLMCRGEYQVKPPLPFTPGAEVAGTVVELGADADPTLLGRRVDRDPGVRTRRVHRADARAHGDGVPHPRLAR